MPTEFGGCATYVALALAAAAAVMSTPGEPDKAWRALELLGASTTLEETVMAGAIGERPEAHQTP